MNTTDIGFQRNSLFQNIASIVFVVAAAASAVYWYVYTHPKPCTKPISYRIGTFDNRFGITEAYFLEAIQGAEALWEAEGRRELFSYKARGDMAINLMYDERQRETQQMQEINTAITYNKETYDAKKRQLQALQDQYQVALDRYNAAVAAFNARASAYQADVSSWNRRGGAPAGEYDRLSDEREELQVMQESLNAMVDELNRLSGMIRTMTDELNSIARTTNSAIHTYNQSPLVGKEFDAGYYSQDRTGRDITIYQFKDETKLVRLLAHELGHALGLGHTENPDSIMYEMNAGVSVRLSTEDIRALDALCGI